MESSDRRVQRTNEALTRALVELILERGFDAITVSEIAERANVGRSTFYAHYADKEDLLQSSIGRMREFLGGHVERALAEPIDGRHPALAFAGPMLEHADEQRDLYQAMVGKRGGSIVLEMFHDLWSELVRLGWPDGDEVAVQTIVGGFGSTVSWWLSQAPELGPAEVEARFRRFVQPALTQSS